MIETLVTIERGGDLPAALFGIMCGVILARFGLVGLVFTGPTLALIGIACVMSLSQRVVLTAEMVFAVAGALAFFAVLR